MTNSVTLNLLRSLVRLRDKKTGEEVTVFITLEKSQLRAAQIVGQSSNELIERIAASNGYDFLNVIDKANRMSVTLPLDELWRRGEAEA